MRACACGVVEWSAIPCIMRILKWLKIVCDLKWLSLTARSKACLQIPASLLNVTSGGKSNVTNETPV